MKILITGTTQGIGKAIAEFFLQNNHTVIGIDRQEASIQHEQYTHYICDVRDRENLPDIKDIQILVNNAGTQNEDDIDINLKALIYITEKYGIQKEIKSILNIGSASGHTGSEFPEYCASKGGVLAYTKNVAIRIAPFGKLVLCHRLSGSETAGNGSSSALGNREKCIQNTLSCNEWTAGRITPCGWSWHTDRPFLSHGEIQKSPIILF